jgi:xanthine dehydrogenase large subunit
MRSMCARRNFYGKNRDVTPYGQQITDNVLPELVGKLEEHVRLSRPPPADCTDYNESKPCILKKGLSLTPVKFGISFTLTHMNQAGALVLAYTDGSVQINHGGTEMGQGLYLKVAQVVAEVFGIGLEKVRICATSTGKVPNTSPTAASSGSDLNGMAAKRAAEEIRDNIANLLARDWRVPKSKLMFADGQISAGQKSMSFAEACKRTHLARLPLSATGFYATPKITWDRARERADHSSISPMVPPAARSPSIHDGRDAGGSRGYSCMMWENPSIRPSTSARSKGHLSKVWAG